MEISAVLCKSILINSKLPASEYCINPYIGCMHGCVYCYARFMQRYTKHTGKWGTWVDVKINAPEILRKQLSSSRKKYEGTILIGSVTDAYQPLELKYEITRRLLKVLLDYQLTVSILTKSHNIVRDVDILSKFDSCDVGISITSLEEDFGRRFEPYASPVKKRIEALRIMKENGISTYVFIGPIFPGFSDIPRIIEAVKDFTDSIMAESLNFRCGNWNDITEIFKKYYPEKLLEFRKSIENPQTWRKAEYMVKTECAKYGISFDGFFIH